MSAQHHDQAVTPPPGLAAWLAHHAYEDRLRGRPIPPGLDTYVRALLYPRSSDIGTNCGPSGNVEITTTQMAGRMGCSDRYVRKLCYQGKLPARRTGSGWLITTSQETDAHGDHETDT